MTWKALRHQNVLPLLGVMMSDDQFAMVSEWMANGTINEFIKTHRDADQEADRRPRALGVSFGSYVPTLGQVYVG